MRLVDTQPEPLKLGNPVDKWTQLLTWGPQWMP